MCLNTSPTATQAASQAASVTVPGASRRGRGSPAWLSPLRVATHIVQLSAVTSQVWSPGRARPRTSAPGMPRTSVRVNGLMLAGSVPAAASDAVGTCSSAGGQVVTWTRTALSSAESKTAAASRARAAGRLHAGAACAGPRGKRSGSQTSTAASAHCTSSSLITSLNRASILTVAHAITWPRGQFAAVKPTIRRTRQPTGLRSSPGSEASGSRPRRDRGDEAADRTWSPDLRRPGPGQPQVHHLERQVSEADPPTAGRSGQEVPPAVLELVDARGIEPGPRVSRAPRIAGHDDRHNPVLIAFSSSYQECSTSRPGWLCT